MRPVARPVVALLVPLLLATGCGTAGKPQPAPVAATRPAGFTSCPRPTTSAVPADLPFTDREALNLGDGLLGHRLTYQRTTARRLVLLVGPDPEDTFEDLDMVQRDTVLGGRPVTLATTHLQPGLALLQVPADVPADCGGLYVISERLTRAELDAVVRTLTVVPGDPAEAPG